MRYKCDQLSNECQRLRDENAALKERFSITEPAFSSAGILNVYRAGLQTREHGVASSLGSAPSRRSEPM
jgi:hypothetical protein